MVVFAPTIIREEGVDDKLNGTHPGSAFGSSTGNTDSLAFGGKPELSGGTRCYVVKLGAGPGYRTGHSSATPTADVTS